MPGRFVGSATKLTANGFVFSADCQRVERDLAARCRRRLRRDHPAAPGRAAAAMRVQRGSRQRRQARREASGRIGGPGLQLGVVEGGRPTRAQSKRVADCAHDRSRLALRVTTSLGGDRVQHERQRVRGGAGESAEPRRAGVERDVGAGVRSQEDRDPSVDRDVDCTPARRCAWKAEAELDVRAAVPARAEGSTTRRRRRSAVRLRAGSGASAAVCSSTPSRT